MGEGTDRRESISQREAAGVLSRRSSLPELDLEARVGILEQRAEGLEQLFTEEVGDAPNELKGVKGRGVWLAVHGLTLEVRRLQADVTGLRNDIQGDRKASEELKAMREAQRAPILRASEKITVGTIMLIIAGGLGALGHWLFTLHH